ncbi:protein kinase [Myxococcus sp. CA051A]|uniref:serine/threonine protein kinase n=1 Tax=Myxococcus sp. CA051A TaxID=2741739 RepID=UPI00157B8548|nr:serine/threonine-protein kinase [Myxococcus sp. CA051A]NTX60258.1 protein kinase [Myxococcus sp. CA051A]
MSTRTPSMNPDALPPGLVITGGWRVIERLGLGGYGVVYRVEPTDAPGRYFALKLARDASEGRALRELTLLLDRAVHPNVVAVHACGRWPDIVTGHFYFVMDWVPGPPLHVWADHHNPTFRQLLETLRRVALALDTLHAGDVLHRDLKPEHILLRTPEGDPVLIDLGAGVYTGAPTLTTGPLPPGTLYLRSPEAIRFHQRHWRHPDARYTSLATDDLYALGVCLYRAATGHYPFLPDWPADVLCAAITSQEPPAPSTVNPRAPPALDALLQRMLDKDPTRRFQSGAELASTLVATLEDTPGEAWDEPLFDWAEPPLVAVDGEPSQALRRVRRPEWASHLRKPPSKARARLQQLWATVLGTLRPPPSPAPWTSPRHATLEGQARRLHSHPYRRLLLTLVGVVALGVFGSRFMGGWRQTTPQVTHEMTSPTGQKLASARESPHSGGVAISPMAEPTPATVAPVAPSLQDPTSVKKAPALSASPPAPVKQRSPSLPRLSKVALACTGLACAGSPSVVKHQPVPAAEDCPPGAREAMARLNIRIGVQVSASIGERDHTGLAHADITLRESRISTHLDRTFGALRRGAELITNIYVTPTRVYGRVVEARIEGKSYPVCMSYVDPNQRGVYGIPAKAGSDDDHGVVANKFAVRAVGRFQETGDEEN